MIRGNIYSQWALIACMGLCAAENAHAGQDGIILAQDMDEGMDSGGDDPFAEEGTAPPKKERKARKKKRKKAVSSTSEPFFGVGANLGYETSYGQSVVAHMNLMPSLDLHFGLGTNSTGFKAGAGSDFKIPMGTSFDLRTGLSLVYSAGSSDTITLDGEITAENGSTSTITASRPYELSSAILASLRAGGAFKISKTFHLIGMINYNLLLSGSEIEFTSDVRYHDSAEVTNREEANKEFEEVAAGKARPGGAGFALGAIFWL